MHWLAFTVKTIACEGKMNKTLEIPEMSRLLKRYGLWDFPCSDTRTEQSIQNYDNVVK